MTRGDLLRLDGQDDDVRLGGHLGVVGRRPAAGGRGESLAGLGERIGGQQTLGGDQSGPDETLPQGRGHLPGADQSDGLGQHSRHASQKRAEPTRGGVGQPARAGATSVM